MHATKATLAHLAKEGQKTGINGVGLGEVVDLAKVADATWVDQRDREMSLQQGLDQLLFVAAGRLDDDAFGFQLPQTLDELGDSLWGGIDGKALAISLDVEAVFGDVDANTTGVGCGDHCEFPALRMRAEGVGPEGSAPRSIDCSGKTHAVGRVPATRRSERSSIGTNSRPPAASGMQPANGSEALRTPKCDR